MLFFLFFKNFAFVTQLGEITYTYKNNVQITHLKLVSMTVRCHSISNKKFFQIEVQCILNVSTMINQCFSFFTLPRLDSSIPLQYWEYYRRTYFIEL